MIRPTRLLQTFSRLVLFAPLAGPIAACSSATEASTALSAGDGDGQASTGAASSQASASDQGSADSGSSAVTLSPDSAESTDSASAPAAAASAPSLGAASSFAMLGASTVTCANLSAVTGDVGVSPGTAITGFDPDCTLTGALHGGDAAAAQAHADLGVAFGALTAAECGHDLTGQDLGGQTLAPGVYCFNTTAGLTGALTLDGGGDGSATWIFQIGTAVTTGAGSSVVMAGSGKAGNVYWQVGSSATIAIGTAFQGNILASASITLVSGSSLVGRALAVNAAVTSDHNAVSLPL